jgi:mRNA interferase YafQ
VAKRISRPQPPPLPLPPPPLTPRPGAEFKRDVKRLTKRGKDMDRLRTLIEALCDHRPLDSRHRDHALSGDWKGWRDCHVEPDWLLIYREESGKLELGRTGTHSDLFE